MVVGEVGLASPPVGDERTIPTGAVVHACSFGSEAGGRSRLPVVPDDHRHLARVGVRPSVGNGRVGEWDERFAIGAECAGRDLGDRPERVRRFVPPSSAGVRPFVATLVDIRPVNLETEGGTSQEFACPARVVEVGRLVCSSNGLTSPWPNRNVIRSWMLLGHPDDDVDNPQQRRRACRRPNILNLLSPFAVLEGDCEC